MVARNHNPTSPAALRLLASLPDRRPTDAPIGDASGAPFGDTLHVQIACRDVVVRHASRILAGDSFSKIDGHTDPSIFSVSPFASTKLPKLMDTLFDAFRSDSFASSASFTSLTSCLSSTRVSRKESCKSSAINESAKIGRHTFRMFGRPIPKSEPHAQHLRQNLGIQGKLVAPARRGGLQARLSVKEPEPHLEERACA